MFKISNIIYHHHISIIYHISISLCLKYWNTNTMHIRRLRFPPLLPWTIMYWNSYANSETCFRNQGLVKWLLKRILLCCAESRKMNILSSIYNICFELLIYNLKFLMYCVLETFPIMLLFRKIHTGKLTLF